ncbi:hypothetical protein E2C01_032315 [Portunus trituberculatus]|uniref:Uncharacterized protein n=1 Tax=Portunus trituberculatus TaxID=210409 RepID=A0A5B7F0R9_PORTR|nr:hypothetical protein [Portunus trituberculatus]
MGVLAFAEMAVVQRLRKRNSQPTFRQVRREYYFSRRQWGMTPALVLPLGRLKNRRQTWEVNSATSQLPRNMPRPISHKHHQLLRPWLRRGALSQAVQRTSPDPSLVVATDASGVIWVYQSEQGHQAPGIWTEVLRRRHINYRELYMVRERQERNQQVCNTAVQFIMDNSTAVRCISRQSTSRLEYILALTKTVFALATIRNLMLSEKHVPGKKNDWADALSRFRSTSVERHLRPQVFQSLSDRFGLPELDLFTSETTAQLST